MAWMELAHLLSRLILIHFSVVAQDMNRSDRRNESARTNEDIIMAKIIAIVRIIRINGVAARVRSNLLTQKLHEAEAETQGFSNRRAVVGDPRTIKQENPLAGWLA